MLETWGHMDEARRARSSRLGESVLFPRIDGRTSEHGWRREGLVRLYEVIMLRCLLLRSSRLLLWVRRQGTEEPGRVGL